MPGSTGPNLGLDWGYTAHESGWGAGYNANTALLDSVVHLTVLGVLDTPPGSPTNGDRYIIGGSPTGAWAGNAWKIVVRLDGAWVFYTPARGWRAHHAGLNAFLFWDGGSWIIESRKRYSYHTPLTGDTIAFGAAVDAAILDPAGTLATLFVTLPGSPYDGQTFKLSSTEDITDLTVNGSSQGLMDANHGWEWLYRATGTTWYRMS